MWYIIGGSLVCLISLINLIYWFRFLDTAERVVGIVLDQVKSGSADGTSYWAIVRFYDKANVEHTVQSKYESGRPYTIGAEIIVYYDPENPKSILSSWKWTMLFKVLVFVLGGLCILYGINEVCSFHAVLQKVFGSNS